MSDVEEVRELVKKIRLLTSTLKTELTAPRPSHDQLLREVIDLDSIQAAEQFAAAAKKFHRRSQVRDCRSTLTEGKRTTAEQDAADYAALCAKSHRR
jgi:hypothetical protein